MNLQYTIFRIIFKNVMFPVDFIFKHVFVHTFSVIWQYENYRKCMRKTCLRIKKEVTLKLLECTYDTSFRSLQLKHYFLENVWS